MLALNVVHPLSYIGQGPTGGGQIIADQTSGPKAKTLYAWGTIINDTTASGTTCPIGYIDGVQSLGKQVVMSFQSATAAATINGVSNQQILYSVQADGQVPVGATITTTGFTNSGNNASSVVTVVGSNFIQVTNSGGVAETTATGLGTFTIGGIPQLVQVYLAQGTGDSAAAVTLASAKSLFATSVTSTGFVLNFPTITTAGAQFTFGAVIQFNA